MPTRASPFFLSPFYPLFNHKLLVAVGMERIPGAVFPAGIARLKTRAPAPCDKGLSKLKGLFPVHDGFQPISRPRKYANKNPQISAGSIWRLIPILIGMTPKEFGQRVYNLRRAKNWSQEVCAERAGISVRTLQMIESYSLKRPTVETTERLAAAFRCSWEDLLGKPSHL
jgi:DNA-binding XRE family transcriptional regulator